MEHAPTAYDVEDPFFKSSDKAEVDDGDLLVMNEEQKEKEEVAKKEEEESSWNSDPSGSNTSNQWSSKSKIAIIVSSILIIGAIALGVSLSLTRQDENEQSYEQQEVQAVFNETIVSETYVQVYKGAKLRRMSPVQISQLEMSLAGFTDRYGKAGEVVTTCTIHNQIFSEGDVSRNRRRLDEIETPMKNLEVNFTLMYNTSSIPKEEVVTYPIKFLIFMNSRQGTNQMIGTLQNMGIAATQIDHAFTVDEDYYLRTDPPTAAPTVPNEDDGFEISVAVFSFNKEAPKTVPKPHRHRNRDENR